MQQEVRLWRVEGGGHLREIQRRPLDVEARLESWLASDISVLDPGLLVIGRQVPTDFGGFIDLLCLDRVGDIVVVELKRDKTPREITAQVLDYGAWIHELSNDGVTGIADEYLRRTSQARLDDAFRERFGTELPDVLNEDHSLLVVGSVIDASSERIIRYLSDAHGVKINAVTFTYFADPSGHEHIARVFLIQPEEVDQRSAQKGASKRRSNLSLEQLEETADQKGVGDVYRQLVRGLQAIARPYALKTLLSFYGKFDDRQLAVINLVPGESSQNRGLVFQLYLARFARLLDRTNEEVESHLPSAHQPWSYQGSSDPEYSGFSGVFRTGVEVDRFLAMTRKP